jgi:hypothetical protein
MNNYNLPDDKGHFEQYGFMVSSMESYHMYIYDNVIPVLETLNLIISFEGGRGG